MMNSTKLMRAGLLVAGYGAGQAVYNVVKGMKIKKEVKKEDLVSKEVITKAAKAAINGAVGVAMAATGAAIMRESLKGNDEVVGVVVLREDNNIDDMLNDEIEDSLGNEELAEAEIEVEVETEETN